MNTTLSTHSTASRTSPLPTLTALPLSPLVFRLLAAKRRVSHTEARLAQKELGGPPSSSAELARLRTMHEDVRMAKDDLNAVKAALAVTPSSGGVPMGAPPPPRTWIDATADVGSMASALASLEAFVWSASGAAAQVQDAAMSLVTKASGKPVPITDPVNTSGGLPASFIRPILSLTQDHHPVGQWHTWVDLQLQMALAQMGPARFSHWGLKLLPMLLGSDASPVPHAADPLSTNTGALSPPHIVLIPGTVVNLLAKHLKANPDPAVPPNKQKPLPSLPASNVLPQLPSYQSLCELAAVFHNYALADVAQARPLDRIPFSEPGILRLVDHAAANATDAWIGTLVRLQIPSDPVQWSVWPTDPPTGAGIGVSLRTLDDRMAIKDAMWLPVAKAKVAHDLLMCPIFPIETQNSVSRV